MRPNQYGIGTNFTRYWPLILSFMMGLIQFYLMARLISGDFLNSYPFISDDGFDWVAQGFGLKGIVLDGDNSVWPILRPPVFVFVTFLDAMIGTGGYLIVGAISLSVSGTALASAYLARRLHFSDFTVLSIMLAVWFYNLAYFRIWILSDAVCIFLMLWSVVLLLCNRPEETHKNLLLSSILAVLSGLTQSYGLLPFVVMTLSFAVLEFVESRDGSMRRYFSSALAVLAISSLVQLIWGELIPHSARPSNFSLLKFSFDMAGFYAGVWPTAFVVFLPALLLIISRRSSGKWMTADLLSLLASSMVFAGLTFFYQWPEARFTYVYWPVVLCLFLVLSRLPSSLEFSQVDKLIRKTCFGIVALGLLVVPGNGYWQPTVRLTNIDWYSTWIAQLWTGATVDRFALEASCGSDSQWCAEAPVENFGSDYIKQIMFEYRRRRITASGE